MPWSTNQTVRISARTAAGERTQPSITYRTPKSVSAQNRTSFSRASLISSSSSGRWERHRHRYELVTSEVVLVEAGSGDAAVATQRLVAMRGVRVLADSPEVDFIATELIRRRLLPAKARLDAVHVAYAAVYQVEFLATWNCRHLANPKIRSAIKTLFDELDKHVPVICTLAELMEHHHDL